MNNFLPQCIPWKAFLVAQFIPWKAFLVAQFIPWKAFLVAQFIPWKAFLVAQFIPWKTFLVAQFIPWKAFLVAARQVLLILMHVAVKWYTEMISCNRSCRLSCLSYSVLFCPCLVTSNSASCSFTVDVPKSMKDHLDILPVKGVVQAQSTFPLWVKFHAKQR